MRSPFAGVIALVATVALCVQNAGSVLAFGWALIHGAGPGAEIAFLPLGISLGLLWGGFRYLNRTQHRHAWALFVAHAIVILLANEALMPATPFDAWNTRRTVKAAEVQNIGDELLLSAKGNPIGIRLTYDVMFPRHVVASVYASLWRAQGESQPFSQWTVVAARTPTIVPAPPSRDIYEVFSGKTRYRFTVAYLPAFLAYDEKAQQPCLRIGGYSDLSESEMVEGIRRAGTDTYTISISFGSDAVPEPMHHADSYVTLREYNLEAMYQTIVAEGHRICPSYM
jgi:hypothetical protein